MNKPYKQIARILAALALLGLAASAALAFGDCARSSHAEAIPQAGGVPRSDAAVSMTDPGLDGLFARYANLHRDAVGYAVADVVDGPLYAKALPDTAAPITR